MHLAVHWVVKITRSKSIWIEAGGSIVSKIGLQAFCGPSLLHLTIAHLIVLSLTPQLLSLIGQVFLLRYIYGSYFCEIALSHVMLNICCHCESA